MYVGVQFEAPEGFGSYMKGVRYYFAGDRKEDSEGTPNATVLIVWFAKSNKRWQSWRVHCMTPSRADFEKAFTCIPPKLKVLGKQFNLPVWMEDVDELNFDAIEESRPNPKKVAAGANVVALKAPAIQRSYRQQVQERLRKIAPALEIRAEILQSPDPLKSISATAYDGDKTKHPHRLQLWFFAYVLHGDSEWALKQPTHRNGLWNRREGKHADSKFGRRSLAGSCFGWSSAGMRMDIVNFYLSKCDEANTMASIHRDYLLKLGCVSVEDECGLDTWVHPRNEPFPSYGQFRSVVVGELTLEFVQTKLYGQPRLRQKAKTNNGNYTEQYANLLEGVEVDAYYVSERPRSLHTDDPAEALVVAEAVCVTTGAVVGVGFSLGSETGEAYRSMLFCMAAPKNYIARLYGVPPDLLKWIMTGIPAYLISDRGPAGHRKIAARLEQAFPIKAIVPSYEGQSKATGEASHPRDVQLEGAPSYVQSNLNVIQMMKRELMRAAGANHSKDISARLSDQAIHDFLDEGRVATPHHYWEYLSKRLRTSARHLSIEQAVRAFWTPIDLPVGKDGVKLRHRDFTSDAFRSSNFLRQVGRVPDLTIRAYVLSLVVRNIWVEVDGQLMELEATKRVRIGEEDLMVPLSELNQTANKLAKLRSQTRLAANASKGRSEASFEAITGVPWSSGKRKSGTPKRASGTTKHEGIVARGPKPTRKAA